MHRTAFDLAAGLWAAQIVDGYAARARPQLSESARAILLEHLALRLAPALAGMPVGDWPDVANAALDAWEDEARTDGPRVAAFNEVAETVRFQAAD